MDWTTIILTVLGIVGTFLGTGLTWLVGKTIKKFGLTEARGEILESVAISVERVYNEGVREAKKANSDGKLSDAERAMFKQMAVNYVKGDLKGLALKTFKGFAVPKITKLIENAVSKAKAK